MTTALVIEDSQIQATYLAGLLREAGYRVLAANDGESGLALLDEEPVALVISDILMPGMDGYEVCRRIKARTDGAALPVVLLTRLDDPTDIIRGLECGADHFITKPFTAADLLQEIATLLENWHHRDAKQIRMGVEVGFLNHRFTLTSDRHQILDLLMRTYERQSAQGRLPSTARASGLDDKAGGVVHDFNSLLSVIGGRSELLLYKLQPGDPLREEIRIILETTQHAAALAEQIAPHDRRVQVKTTVTNLNGLLRDLIPTLRTQLGEGVEIHEFYAPKLPKISMDRADLVLTITKIAASVGIGAAGNRSLYLETHAISIDPLPDAPQREAKPGTYVQLIVTGGKNASGKTAETVNRQATSAASDDLPLSLATAFAVIQHVGGFWETTRGLGGETTVIVTIPAHDPGVASSKTGVQRIVRNPTLRRDGRSTVLIVEDEEQIGRMMKEVLDIAGYYVLRARTPSQALEIIAQLEDAPDLVITDVVLPEMSGPELIARIRETVPDLAMLLISGYGEWSTQHHQMIEPGTPFLQKPFSLAALTKRVAELIRKPDSASAAPESSA